MRDLPVSALQWMSETEMEMKFDGLGKAKKK